jgi:hypothetical protein
MKCVEIFVAVKKVGAANCGYAAGCAIWLRLIGNERDFWATPAAVAAKAGVGAKKKACGPGKSQTFRTSGGAAAKPSSKNLLGEFSS